MGFFGGWFVCFCLGLFFLGGLVFFCFVFFLGGLGFFGWLFFVLVFLSGGYGEGIACFSC